MLVSRRFLVLLAAISAPAWATAVVNTSLDLTSFQILPASGTLNILSPVTAFVFAQALDSTGASDQNTNSVNDAATSVSALTSLANATATASALTLTGSVTANGNVPNGLTAFSTSEGEALLSGMFEITGVTGPVSVNIIAALSINQLVMTSGNGQAAASETTLTLTLPDISSSPILSFDNPLSIGAGGSMNSVASPTLTTTVVLPSNTPLSFDLALDGEYPNGVNIVPEPSSLLLTAAGVLAVIGRRLRPKHRV
jgi:hypothetical protein